MLGRVICVAALACASSAFADSPTAAIPLKDIWAFRMPETKDIRELDPDSSANARALESSTVEQIRRAVRDGPSQSAFAVIGTANDAPFGVSLYDSHELEKDLYIGSGPAYGEYGFAFTVTTHFNDGVTLTTGPLVDIFVLSDPNDGDFADTASVTQQDQATFDIYRAIVRGDFNLDAHHDARDISVMMSALTNPSTYQTAFGVPNRELLALGDVNQDGRFTNADLEAFLDLLKSGGGSNSSVPEPISFVLLVIGGITLLCYCHRGFNLGLMDG